MPPPNKSKKASRAGAKASVAARKAKREAKKAEEAAAQGAATMEDGDNTPVLVENTVPDMHTCSHISNMAEPKPSVGAHRASLADECAEERAPLNKSDAPCVEAEGKSAWPPSAFDDDGVCHTHAHHTPDRRPVPTQFLPWAVLVKCSPQSDGLCTQIAW